MSKTILSAALLSYTTLIDAQNNQLSLDLALNFGTPFTEQIILKRQLVTYNKRIRTTSGILSMANFTLQVGYRF